MSLVNFKICIDLTCVAADITQLCCSSKGYYAFKGVLGARGSTLMGFPYEGFRFNTDGVLFRFNTDGVLFRFHIDGVPL